MHVNILTVGKHKRHGVNVAFGAVGPTADGRIKPDVMAYGSPTCVIRAVETSSMITERRSHLRSSPEWWRASGRLCLRRRLTDYHETRELAG